MYVLVGVLKPLFIDDIIKSTWMFLVLSREFYPVRLFGLYPLPLFNSFNHCINRWRKKNIALDVGTKIKFALSILWFHSPNPTRLLIWTWLIQQGAANMTSTQILQNINVWRRKKILSWDSVDNIYYDPKDAWWNDARSQSYGPHKKTQALQILFAMSPLRQPLMLSYLRAIHSMW